MNSSLNLMMEGMGIGVGIGKGEKWIGGQVSSISSSLCFFFVFVYRVYVGFLILCL